LCLEPAACELQAPAFFLGNVRPQGPMVERCRGPWQSRGTELRAGGRSRGSEGTSSQGKASGGKIVRNGYWGTWHHRVSCQGTCNEVPPPAHWGVQRKSTSPGSWPAASTRPCPRRKLSLPDSPPRAWAQPAQYISSFPGASGDSTVSARCGNQRNPLSRQFSPPYPANHLRKALSTPFQRAVRSKRMCSIVARARKRPRNTTSISPCGIAALPDKSLPSSMVSCILQGPAKRLRGAPSCRLPVEGPAASARPRGASETAMNFARPFDPHRTPVPPP